MPQPNPAHVALAARLIQARQAAGLATVDAAVIHLGMSAQTYRLYEQGQHAVTPAELRR